MYNYPYEYFRQQPMAPMNLNQMDNMQDMGYQQPLYNQMPTMPMQPIQPMMPMGTVPGTMGTTTGGMGTPTGAMTFPMGTTTGLMTTPMGGVQEVPGTTSGVMPTTIAAMPLALDQQGELPVADILYTQGWLTTQIGQRVKIEFLIGTNMLIDREGTLLEVGISYVIINEVETDDLLLCDIYSIKFVRIYR